MEFKEGTGVFTASGEEVGKINRFVLDPATSKVTHIVVQKGWLLPEDKVVPTDTIETASEDRVILKEAVGDLDQLPPFEETHYVGLDESDRDQTDYFPYGYAPAYYWYPPYGFAGYPTYGLGYYGWTPVETERNIPEDTVPIKEGSGVVSSDGEHFGDVERIFVDSESKRATHFLISQGLLFKEQKLVPVHWVGFVEENKVHLAVPLQLLEQLPDYQT
jgi:uncharacterized protein YrrD